MKFLKNCLIAAGITALFFSCSKTDTNLKPSTGILKSNDTTGDCLPLTVNGKYIAGVALNSDNYIDVHVNTTSIGSFNIYTDTVNGISFASSNLESLGTTGENRIRLYSHGSPLAPGLTTLNVIYNGSHCTVSIIVGGLAPGNFILTDTPRTLAAAAVSGAYTTGIPLNTGDSVEMVINVTKPGSISITSNAVDGISFSGIGIFTTTGQHVITLIGTGVPQNPGTFAFWALDSASDSSNFKVTVLPYGGASAATFTMLGAPNSCAGFSSYGTYTAGLKMQAEDSVTTYINVTKAGLYSIVTNQANGVIFTATGSADSGQHMITLRASGLPAASGTYYYSATGDSSTCSFGINYTQGAGIFILGGAPGACTITSANGTYKTDSALGSNNTVTIPVTVTTAGAYKITTATVDGMTFTGAGNFVTTGPQSIVLTGKGVPVSPGITNFLVPSRTGNCGFTVNVAPATAEFTLNTEPYGQCSGSTLNGKYNTSVPLTSSNTATVKVNVTYPGPYTINTDTAIDGIMFTSTGRFSSKGIQTVVLQASGTPTKAGTFVFSVQGGMDVYGTGSACSITVTVTGAVIPIVAAFSGVVNKDTATSNTTATSFTHFASASSSTTGSLATLRLGGSSTGGDSLSFTIQGAAGTVKQGGTYTETTSGLTIDAYYDSASTAYLGGSKYSGTPVTITVTKLTATEIAGTYTATLKDNNGTGTNIIKITTGKFDLPIQ